MMLHPISFLILVSTVVFAKEPSDATQPWITDHVHLPAISTSLKRLIFLGTGSSYGLPLLTCFPLCELCASGMKSTYSPNRRRNTSVFVQNEKNVNILVDCGKTFYESARDFLLPMGVTTIDHVVLSHVHADAINGLDDLRLYNKEGGPTIHADHSTLEGSKIAFPHVFGKPISKGVTAQLKGLEFAPFASLNLNGTSVQSIPVEHGRTSSGDPFMTNAFLIDDHIFYASDLSGISDDTVNYLLEKRVRLLILDCATSAHDSLAHIGLDSALSLHTRLQPIATFLTDISHSTEHYQLQAMLPDNIYVARDGLHITF